MHSKFIRLCIALKELNDQILRMDEKQALILEPFHSLKKAPDSINDLVSARKIYTDMHRKYTAAYFEILGVKNKSIASSVIYWAGVGFGFAGLGAGLICLIAPSAWMSAVSFIGLASIHPALAMTTVALAISLLVAVVAAAYEVVLGSKLDIQPSFNRI